MSFIPKVLIIAGSDSGGGAGIQADIKTITSLGSYAMTAITAITAQNTTGVVSVFPIPPDELKKQIKYWNADYCIAYQLDSSNLEDKWLAADFIKVSDLSWKSLADKEDLTLPGELYPYWFLLQPLKK